MNLEYLLNLPTAMQYKTIKIGNNEYSAFEGFQEQYFMKDRLLFSLDVIYFRIILGLLTFLIKKSSNTDEPLTLALKKLLENVRIDDLTKSY